MRKKKTKEEVFKKFQVYCFNRYFKQDFRDRVRKYKKEINPFRKEWLLAGRKIKTDYDYQCWLKETEEKLSYKRFKIDYFEEEEGHTLQGYDTVAIELFTLMENSPRITSQGNSVASVFDYRFRQLMRKVGIDPDWYGLFLNYLFTDKFDPKLITRPNIEVTERFLYGPENDEIDHRLSLNIGPNTRKEDVDSLWQFVIEPLQKKMKSLWKGTTRKKPTRKIALRMLRLHNQGKTVPEILQIPSLNTDKWDETKVRKAIARAKKWVEK